MNREDAPEKKFKISRDFFGKDRRKHYVKTNKRKNTTEPTSISVGTELLQHYWNSDSFRVWSAGELEEVVGDTSTLQPLLEEGFQPFPGSDGFTCEMQRIGRGALFRIFEPARSLLPPTHYGPAAPTSGIEGIPPGVLFAVAGVAADDRSAESVWRRLQSESVDLYAAHEAGFGVSKGHGIASVSHICNRPSRPKKLPWLSFMAYNPVLHENQLYYPDDDTLVLWVAKEWLHSLEIQRGAKQEMEVAA